MIYDFVFVVVTYRNSSDLCEFIESCRNVKGSYKIIIINSFYDQSSHDLIKTIAINNNCDFLSVENRGYGYGNNKGIDIALNNYEFLFLVVSNPDIKIIDLSAESLEKYSNSIIGPIISQPQGHDQNPYFPFYSLIIIWLRNIYINRGNPFYYFLANFINKIYRLIHKLFFQFGECSKVYALHGSFFILPKKIINDLLPVFNENIFLFGEEEYLAIKAKRKLIKMFHIKKANVLHNKHGSMKLVSQSIHNITRESLRLSYDKSQHT